MNMNSVLKLCVASVVLYVVFFNRDVYSEQFQDGGRNTIRYSRGLLMLLMSHTDSSAYTFSDFPHEMYATSDIPPLSETKENGKEVDEVA